MQAFAGGPPDLFHDRPLAPIIGGEHRLDDAHPSTTLFAGPGQRSRILGEAGTTKTRTRAEKLRANTAVQSDAMRDFHDAGVKFFTEIGDFVDECDLGGKQAVGGILDQFRRAALCGENASILDSKVDIDAPENGQRPLGFGTDHDPVRFLEVSNGTAGTQELRVRCHIEIEAWPQIVYQLLEAIAGTYRHRRFDHNEAAVPQHWCNRRCDLVKIR